MRLIGFILAACIVLAVVRAVVLALIILMGGALIVGAFTKPRETFALIAVVMFAGLVENHPLTLLVAISAIVVVGVVMASREGQ